MTVADSAAVEDDTLEGYHYSIRRDLNIPAAVEPFRG